MLLTKIRTKIRNKSAKITIHLKSIGYSDTLNIKRDKKRQEVKEVEVQGGAE